MFETVVVATDGSESVDRAVALALDLAERFDAAVHALSVVEDREIAGAPEAIRAEVEDALRTHAEAAVGSVRQGADRTVTTAVREGDPPAEIQRYARERDADVIVLGTRGRHEEHGLVLGSVAKAVVRRSPIPVLTARRLDE